MIIKKEGFKFAFDESGCANCNGNCCIGESGYIWIDEDEIKNLATFLNLEIKDVKNRYLDKYYGKYTIKEKKIDNSNYACIFFDVSKRRCLIYDYRPKQCRTFPFWEHFKENYEEVLKECPAILVY